VRKSLVILAGAVGILLQGCAARPTNSDATPPALAAAACAPLPVCSIPPASSSTQLEQALWECVLEYRALYSVCYHMQHLQKE
jgi:uncharacterized lipoprotein YajG